MKIRIKKTVVVDDTSISDKRKPIEIESQTANPVLVDSDKIILDRLLFNQLVKELNDIKITLHNYANEIKNLKLQLKIDLKPILIEMKKDNISNKIEPHIVINALRMQNPMGDAIIFREYYIKNTGGKPPIQLISSRKFKYWCEDQWHEDTYGYHIADIAIANIKRCYQIANSMTFFTQDEFLTNCLHIQNMTEDKYKREFVKYVSKELASCSPK